MGWTSSSDMKSQVKLRFDSKEEAIAYAARNGVAYRVEEPKLGARKIVSYSDNFAQPRRSLVALSGAGAAPASAP
jgi:hypothetical protein